MRLGVCQQGCVGINGNGFVHKVQQRQVVLRIAVKIGFAVAGKGFAPRGEPLVEPCDFALLQAGRADDVAGEQAVGVGFQLGADDVADAEDLLADGGDDVFVGGGDDEQFVACAAVSVYEVFGGLAGVGGDVLRLELLVQCVALGGGEMGDGSDLKADEIGNIQAA